MKDNELVSDIQSLQYAFAASAGRKGIDGKDHYEGQAAEMAAVISDIEKHDYFSAQKKLDNIRRHFASAAYHLEYAIGKEGMFSDKKSGMKLEKEDLQSQESKVQTILWQLERRAKEHAEKHAADDTDTLMAAAENLKSKMTFDNRYGATGDIADFLILATKNQQRQEKLLAEQAKQLAAHEKSFAAQENILNTQGKLLAAYEKREKVMSDKITALEKRLAEIEGPVLDKPKIRPSGAGLSS